VSLFGVWTPLVALAATLLPLLWVKRWITEHLQLLSLRWLDDRDVALVVYFVIVLPGVVVHELSHWLAAKLLGVKVSKFSLGPVRKGRSSKVSLGSVRVANVDPLRGSLIGLAPLLGATVVILGIGYWVLGIEELVQAFGSSGVEGLLGGLGQLVRVPDFWLWLYFIFAVSNAMLPSESDLAALRPLLIFLGIVAAVVLVVSGVPAIPPRVVEAVNAVAGYLASAFGLTLAVDLVFALVILGLTLLTDRFKGRW
jgi:membrane-associated protease RseP (regulator of RpoE activity)